MIENVCLCCGKKLRLETDWFQLFYQTDVICQNCRYQLGFYPKRIKISGTTCWGLYPYQDQVRDLMIQYKEYFDEALKSIFLSPIAKSLKQRYHDYVIVPIPSSQKNRQQRGFDQVVEMFAFVDLPIKQVLRKTQDIDQKQLNYQKRSQISQVLELCEKNSIVGKKVLLVDDILTTGQTIKAALALLQPYCKKVEVLVICYNKRYLTAVDRWLIKMQI